MSLIYLFPAVLFILQQSERYFMSFLCRKLYNAPHWIQNTIKIYLIGLKGLVYSPAWACNYQAPYYLSGLNSNYFPSAHSTPVIAALAFSKMPDKLPPWTYTLAVPSTQNALLPDICLPHLLQAFVQMSSHLFFSLATYAFCTTVIAFSILFFYRASNLYMVAF